METLIRSVATKKAELDRLRPQAPNGLSNREHSHDLELAYTSNAIEGNTLTAAETTMVIELGITIGGKPLRHHLEAIDHYDAIRYVRELARQPAYHSAAKCIFIRVSGSRHDAWGQSQGKATYSS